jgi:hypothetical protein
MMGGPSLGQVGGAELAGYHGEMPPSWRSLPVPRIDSIYLPFSARRPCSPRRVWTGPCLRKQRRVLGIPLAYKSATLRPRAISGNREADRKVACCCVVRDCHDPLRQSDCLCNHGRPLCNGCGCVRVANRFARPAVHGRDLSWARAAPAGHTGR